MLAEEQEYSSLRPLVDWLDYNGYTVVSKPAKEFVDANGRRKIKGSMEVELSVDAMRYSSSLDHFVLVTGDGSYRWLAFTLQQIGKRVTVISTMQTQPHMVSDDLRRQADQFIDLGDLEPLSGDRGAASAKRAASRCRPAAGPTRAAPEALRRAGARAEGRLSSANGCQVLIPWTRESFRGSPARLSALPTPRCLSRSQPRGSPRGSMRPFLLSEMARRGF